MAQTANDRLLQGPTFNQYVGLKCHLLFNYSMFAIPRTSSGCFFWLNAFRLFFLTDSMFFARCPFFCLKWFLQFPVTFSSWLCITASMHNIPQDHRKMWFRVFSPDLCLFLPELWFFFARFFEGFFWYLFKSLTLMCCNHSEASIAAELLFLPEWGFLPGKFFFARKLLRLIFLFRLKLQPKRRSRYRYYAYMFHKKWTRCR